jgi:hypothetical protein
VTQQARNLLWAWDEARVRPRALIRDRDAKFTRSFDDILRAEGIRVVRAPFREPRARARAERWMGTVRRECLDWLLIVGRRHLERVPDEYVEHYNAARPHRGLQLGVPLAHGQPVSAVGEIVRRDRLDGLIHEYERPAA